MTHICVGKLTIIGSDNGLSPERRQAIIWTNAVILLIGPLGTNFSENRIEIQTFSLKKIRLKMSSARCCSFRLGLNVLIISINYVYYIYISYTSGRYTLGKFVNNHQITTFSYSLSIYIYILHNTSIKLVNTWYMRLLSATALSKCSALLRHPSTHPFEPF